MSLVEALTIEGMGFNIIGKLLTPRAAHPRAGTKRPPGNQVDLGQLFRQPQSDRPLVAGCPTARSSPSGNAGQDGAAFHVPSRPHTKAGSRGGR